MTAHERFKKLLERRRIDRPPIDYLASRTLDARVRAHLGVETEAELLGLLGADFYYLSVRDISQVEACGKIYHGPELSCSETERTCPLGIRYQRGQGDWKFGADEAIRGPLENAQSVQDVLRHPWPRPQWFDVEALLPECEGNSGRVIVCGFWTAIFGNAYRMHGIERFLMNMSLEPELIRTLVNRLTDFYLELNERLFSVLDGRADVFFFGNDFGTQQGLLFSEAMWLDFFFESYRRIVAQAHDHGLTVMTHSCGSIARLLPHLIEAGVDIVDPVQTSAAEMEPQSLKHRYGDRLIFHGAIDTQHVLPRCRPDEVHEHTRRTIDVLGSEGGYIMAPCNNLQDDTPVENVLAMYRAAREYGF